MNHCLTRLQSKIFKKTDMFIIIVNIRSKLDYKLETDEHNNANGVCLVNIGPEGNSIYFCLQLTFQGENQHQDF